MVSMLILSMIVIVLIPHSLSQPSCVGNLTSPDLTLLNKLLTCITWGQKAAYIRRNLPMVERVLKILKLNIISPHDSIKCQSWEGFEKIAFYCLKWPKKWPKWVKILMRVYIALKWPVLHFLFSSMQSPIALNGTALDPMQSNASPI